MSFLNTCFTDLDRLIKIICPVIFVSIVVSYGYTAYDTITTVNELSAFLDHELAYAESNHEHFKTISEKYKKESLAYVVE